ncbi:MAG: DegT/DnrJ/EryC1/StrS aminotransferase family protein, partial [Hyphomicrobiales bacterium]|nr:DegT/DnrJ/EryC1/StrS aminotransferase family protein [Hyphomicrobiales bacterium]
MDELRAAIGLLQLKRLKEWNAKRLRLTQAYMRSLAARCPELCLPFAAWRKTSNHLASHHIMPIVLPESVDRQRVVDGLRDAEIQTTIHYPPIHETSFYRENFPCAPLPLTEQFAQRELTLPLHPRMEEHHVERVTDAMAKALDRAAPAEALS